MSFLGGVASLPPNNAVSLWDLEETTNKTYLEGYGTVFEAPVVGIQQGILAFWIKVSSLVSSSAVVNFLDTYQNASDSRGFRVWYQAGNINLNWTDTSGSSLCYLSQSIGGASFNNDLWQHFAISYTPIGGGTGRMQIARFDGYDQYFFSTTSTINAGTPFGRYYLNINKGLGGEPTADPALVEFADIYHDINPFDLSELTNRRKFITADNKKVNLGLRGQRVRGDIPDLFFSGSYGSWLKNKGSLLLSNNNLLTPYNSDYFIKSPTKPT
jgi:hypothetical protein